METTVEPDAATETANEQVRRVLGDGGRDILRAHLTPAQKTSLTRWSFFSMTTSAGNTAVIARELDYNVMIENKYDVSGQLTLTHEGERKHGHWLRFCARLYDPDGTPLSLWDQMLAQMMMLTLDESAFRQIANEVEDLYIDPRPHLRHTNLTMGSAPCVQSPPPAAAAVERITVAMRRFNEIAVNVRIDAPVIAGMPSEGQDPPPEDDGTEVDGDGYHRGEPGFSNEPYWRRS